MTLTLGLPLLLVAGLAACSSAPKKTIVVGSLEASPQVNPSVSKRPSPILVRVYELKAASAFNTTDFMSLYQGDTAALAADLVSRDEFMLQPGERRPYDKTLAPETKFIGVLAAYRDLERAVWRTVVTVHPGEKQKLTVRADELVLSAIVQR